MPKRSALEGASPSTRNDGSQSKKLFEGRGYGGSGEERSWKIRKAISKENQSSKKKGCVDRGGPLLRRHLNIDQKVTTIVESNSWLSKGPEWGA